MSAGDSVSGAHFVLGAGMPSARYFLPAAAKSMQKHRQKPDGFWTSFARSAHFRPLGCVPHVLGAMQGASNVGSSPRAPFYRSPTCRPERIPKPWFWRAFWYFSRTGKVPVGDMNQPIQPPLPRQTQKQTGEGFSGLPYITTYSPPSPQTRGNPSPAPLCRRREPPSP